jgi:Ring finger domain
LALQSGIVHASIIVEHDYDIFHQKSQHFASRQDTDSRLVGKHLWKGYRYPARLQHFPQHLSLCPTTDTVFNVSLPSDGTPVALLGRDPARVCSLRDKLQWVQTYLRPRGAVQYIILESSGSEDEEEEEIMNMLLPKTPTHASKQQLRTSSGYEESTEGFSGLEASFAKSKPLLQEDKPFPFYVLRVSFGVAYTLQMDLESAASYNPQAFAEQGGLRLSLDSRLGTSSGMQLDGTTLLWIAITALCTAALCTCLLLIFGDPESNPFMSAENLATTAALQQAAAASRQTQRRRLTREQIKRLLPRYLYSGPAGGPLRLLDDHGKVVPAAPESDGLETPLLSEEVKLPPVSELECCSICLDDYDIGDKLRVTSCGHAFHSRCIGRWLHERSATCPLCKTEVVDDLEDDDEEEDVEAPQPAPAVADPPSLPARLVAPNWLLHVNGVMGLNNDENVTRGDAPVPAPAADPPIAGASPTVAPRPWWRQLFSSAPARRPTEDTVPSRSRRASSSSLREPLLQMTPTSTPPRSASPRPSGVGLEDMAMASEPRSLSSDVTSRAADPLAPPGSNIFPLEDLLSAAPVGTAGPMSTEI